MLFYASLFLFCVALSAVVVWFYRSLDKVGKTIYRAFLPSSKGNIKKEPPEPAATVNGARVPWGWNGTGAERGLAPAEAIPAPVRRTTIPWGWPGNRGKEKPQANRVTKPSKQPAAPEQANLGATVGQRRAKVGWPYREESFEFAGRTYRVNKRAKVKGSTNAGGAKRPWGW